MFRIIGVTEMQRHFRSVFEEVVTDRVPCVLTRGSRPEAAVIPYEEFLRFQEFQAKDVLARFDCLVTRMAEQNESVDEDEVAADVVLAKAEIDH